MSSSPTVASAPRDMDAATPASATIAASRQAVGRRRLLGILVVGFVMLLQTASDYVTGRDGSHIVARLCFLSVELPILMLALSSTFSWAMRRHLNAAWTLLSGIGVSTLFGCVFGLLYSAVAHRVPAMHLRVPHGLSHARAVLFGVLHAQLYFGLWALAFVYPSAIESARLRTLEAQKLRSEAELAQLRANLQPHFMLNTLNAIAGLVVQDPREARHLIVCLGDLLRDGVLDTGNVQRLDQQVAWLRRYAEILEARHRGSLRFQWDIAPDAERILLPKLLLQPIVENAVRHGALRRPDGGGEVSVRAALREDGALACTVTDNGPGLGERNVRTGAFGLHAVRRRLELEARGASLRIESGSAGTRIVIDLPPMEALSS